MARRAKKVKPKTVALKPSGIEQASPCSPSRPPRYVIYATLSGTIVNVTAWYGTYAAKRVIDLMLDGREYEWEDRTRIRCGDLLIKSDQLEDIIEYEYRSDEERDWSPDQEMPSIFKAAGKVHERPEPEQRIAEARKAVRPPKRESKPRASREGLVSAGDIATELGVSPREVRGVLRSLKLEKPEAGWAWPTAEAKKIAAMIKKGLK